MGANYFGRDAIQLSCASFLLDGANAYALAKQVAAGIHTHIERVGARMKNSQSASLMRLSAYTWIPRSSREVELLAYLIAEEIVAELNRQTGAAMLDALRAAGE